MHYATARPESAGFLEPQEGSQGFLEPGELILEGHCESHPCIEALLVDQIHAE